MATYSKEYLAAQARQGWRGLTLSKKQESAARSAGYGKSLEAAYSSGSAQRAQPTQHIMPYPYTPEPTTAEPTAQPTTAEPAGGIPLLPLLIAAAAIVVALVVR